MFLGILFLFSCYCTMHVSCFWYSESNFNSHQDFFILWAFLFESDIVTRIFLVEAFQYANKTNFLSLLKGKKQTFKDVSRDILSIRFFLWNIFIAHIIVRILFCCLLDLLESNSSLLLIIKCYLIGKGSIFFQGC